VHLHCTTQYLLHTAPIKKKRRKDKSSNITFHAPLTRWTHRWLAKPEPANSEDPMWEEAKNKKQKNNTTTGKLN
jgi:hypothetical protein